MRRETRRKSTPKVQPKGALHASLERMFGPAGGVAFTFGVAFLITCCVALVAGPLLTIGGAGKIFRMVVVAVVLTFAYYAYDRMKR